MTCNCACHSPSRKRLDWVKWVGPIYTIGKLVLDLIKPLWGG